MTNVLILVLSCKETPFDNLMACQKRTWDSLAWNGVKTAFYVGGSDAPKIDGNVIHVCWSDGYWDMAHKFKLALDFVWDWKWDFVFRTNASSYVCKRRLHELVSTLATERIYAGKLGSFGATKKQFVGGSGMLLSRDVCSMLMTGIQPGGPTKVMEDLQIGIILNKLNVSPVSLNRVDLLDIPDSQPVPDGFVYRCKPQQCDELRQQDQLWMQKIFRSKTGLYKV